MSNGFTYSETSAFSPVPFDIYECSLPSHIDIDLLSPPYELEEPHSLQNTLIEQWVAGLHPPTYETIHPTPFELGMSPLGYLTHPYLHDCFSEPGFIRKRNERERMRVRNVNEGYARLREHLPSESKEKRMSKVETLRSAIKYIKQLQSLLKEESNDSSNRTNEIRNMQLYSEKQSETTRIEVLSTSFGNQKSERKYSTDSYSGYDS